MRQNTYGIFDKKYKKIWGGSPFPRPFPQCVTGMKSNTQQMQSSLHLKVRR